jgi:hypothetical protein
VTTHALWFYAPDWLVLVLLFGAYRLGLRDRARHTRALARWLVIDARAAQYRAGNIP